MAPESAPVAALRALIARSGRIVGFTGAGISTESGIPDFRSKGGIWERYKPVLFNEFLEDPAKRKLAWQRTLELWPAVRDARPNTGHCFFVSLHRDRKLLGLITQNVDGLHEKSGLPPELVVNLHGSALEVACLSCSARYSSEEIAERALASGGVPTCLQCGGVIKPDTISFGQPLRPADLQKADRLARSCDLMIAMGSTLQVHPAAGIPVTAKRAGAALAIVTLSETPLDRIADVVVNMRIGELVERLAGPAPTR
jgi:NAD-dependent deacetylase